MFTRIRTSLFVAVLLCLQAGLAQAMAPIQHWVTEKGARVYFVPADGLPMVDVNVTFAAGSARNGGRAGTSYLTNAMLDTGAAGMSADEIAERIDSLGARLGSGSARDMAWVTLRSLSDDRHLDPALDILANVVGRPDFNDRDFKRERARAQVSVRQGEQSPSTVAGNEIFQQTYGDHPYAARVSGTVDDLAALGADDLKAFHREFYVAANAVIGIVGDVDRKAAEAIAEKVTQHLVAGKCAAPLPEVKQPAAGRQKRIVHPSSQTHVRMAAPGIRRGDPDYFALYVGNHVLGGSGLVSRLSNEIREKRGLSYHASSYFSPMEQYGPYLFSLQTRNDQVDEALSVMRDTLKKYVKDGPTEEELVNAKKNITGGFALRIDSNSKILDYIVMIGFYDLPLDYLETFNDRVEAVTREQIVDAYRRRVKPELMQTVIVGGAAG